MRRRASTVNVNHASVSLSITTFPSDGNDLAFHTPPKKLPPRVRVFLQVRIQAPWLCA
jgi:hypothetical protein